MNALRVVVFVLTGCLIFSGAGAAHAQDDMSNASGATLLASGLEGASGSAIGPDGALYATEGVTGEISRIDLETGEVSTFVSGLPPQLIPIGGVMDIAFVDDTAYALVSMVADDVGGTDVVGVYQIDGPDSFTVVADIGEFSAANVPTNTDIDLATGVQYAFEPHGDGFIVTDGHHNRILMVGLDGSVSELMAFDNIVPTGLAIMGGLVYMAEAGPVPHIPDHGKVKSIDLAAGKAMDVASGARLVVDVEVGEDGTLYALAQGDWDAEEAGAPSLPNTGSLLTVGDDGTFTVVADNLNMPTSMELVGDTAYVISAAGDVLSVDLAGDMAGGCSLGTLEGAFVFQGTGAVADEEGVVPYAQSGIFIGDGEGAAAGFVSVSVNGEPIARGEPYSATYEMTDDCVYVMTVESYNEYELYAIPSGDVFTYSGPGYSGVMYRH